MEFSTPPEALGTTPSSFDISSSTEVESISPASQKQPKEKSVSYFPLYETLRLYAGWLLAWYGVIYAVGAYQHIKVLPFRIPYAESLFLSPLVLSFTFASFVFLLFTTLSKALPAFHFKSAILFLAGTTIFMLYRMNIA